MPRTLPWLLDKAKEKRVKHEETPRKRVKRESDVDPDVTPKQPPLSPEKRDFFRSSQTPPTSPARPGPTEEYILEGLDRDDAWVMVEDEFYTIAQSFTQHLHYAEYVRRKKEAKARGEAAIGEVERPTDGRTAISKGLQIKKQAEELQARQKDGMAQLGLVDQQEELSDDDDDTWAGTHLHGLMTSPQKSRSLIGVQRLKSSTRAAAGFGQTSHIHASSSRTASTRSSSPAMASPSRATKSHAVEIDLETESEDDDLDGDSYPITISSNRRMNSPPSKIPKIQTKPQPQTTRTHTTHRQNTPTVSKQTQAPAQASTKSRKPAVLFKSKVQMLFDDLDELPEPSQSSSISDRKRDVNSGTNTPQRAPSDNNLESKSRYKDVPIFFF
ncbi:uncharacterized protein N7483_010787 [Penicillium malachiteum]|uniref:uncharacterized protein n=1 Tax=Penicillium malachiteum TaxID=1324776 RepID=UPI0025472C51|nr:uncharacterized protein N7483_010787 [Penicillium malachiteum]KAJ5713606.1 hypothetical protein N7483_010787 [Penicillium malachiteum]